MSDRSDVLIIGGGVVGLCCAYFLEKAGCSVRVVTRERVGSGRLQHQCRHDRPQPLCAAGFAWNAVQRAGVAAETGEPILHLAHPSTRTRSLVE
ncbi:MAG: FAD-dependent oxidoreductase [candidate division KSB1 bacterium]|nr:FAD-dependent oxidoreductase [candidate division KSB1 bacterium]